MIKIGETTIDFNEPVILGMAVVSVLLLLLIIAVLRMSGKSGRAAEPLMR